jgi:hypothetical protein
MHQLELLVGDGSPGIAGYSRRQFESIGISARRFSASPTANKTAGSGVAARLPAARMPVGPDRCRDASFDSASGRSNAARAKDPVALAKSGFVDSDTRVEDTTQPPFRWSGKAFNARQQQIRRICPTNR